MRHLMYLFLLFFSVQLVAQPCSIVDVVLTTQGQVDSFRINYPLPCTQLAKSLIISGEDITNLDSLIGIDFIGKDLIVAGCPMLTSLRGLDSLVVVGRHVKILDNLTLFDVNGLDALQSIIGQLWIMNNPSLQNLDGLGQLVGVTGNFRLEDNAALADLTGLSSLGAIGGNFTVKNNDSLTNFYKLRKLGSIGGSLVIQNNPALVQVSDLSHLTSIGGHLIMINNASLQSVMGFIHLTSINGYLYVRNNPVLPTLLGLDNIDPTSIIYLILKDNAVLTLCSVTSVCEYLSMGLGPFLINGNPSDCANDVEITTLCLVLPVEMVSFDAKRVDEGVLLNWETASENENKGFFVQRSLDLQNWETLGFVPSASTFGNGAKYDFLDSEPLSGTVFYRLEQTDMSGRSNYSEVVAVTLGDALQQFSFYPNPTKGMIWIDGISEEGSGSETVYRLYDHTGRLVQSAVLSSSDAIDLTALPQGLYWVELQTGGERTTFKIVKE